MKKLVKGEIMNHYNNFHAENNSIEYLRKRFKDGPDELNFVLFSTSGIHGTYNTIEDFENNQEMNHLTFLIVMPRIVSMVWGELDNLEKEDIPFLKKLRKDSIKIVASIGFP